MGVFLSLLLKAGYGTDTSSFMNSSIASRLDLPLGPVMICVNTFLFIVQLIWGRSLIVIGTVANMTLIGFTSDFCTGIWQTYLPDMLFTAQPERIIIFIIALAGFLISAALYMNSESGLAPYDPSQSCSAVRCTFLSMQYAQHGIFSQSLQDLPPAEASRQEPSSWHSHSAVPYHSLGVF